MTKRLDWHDYFLNIAYLVATRATCDRKHVGTVLVRDNRILVTGYNGSIAGQAHCDEVGHFMVEEHCIRTVHAEANAVGQAAALGIALKSAIAYVTAYPCITCYKLLANSGVAQIYYAEEYRNTGQDNALRSAPPMLWYPPKRINPGTS